MKYVLLALSLLLFGCQKEEQATEVKTGVELVAVGAIKFGSVTIGEYREATIRITNHGPDAIPNFVPTSLVTSPFAITQVTSPCTSGSIPVEQVCTITVRFTPTTKGNFVQVIQIGNATQETSGRGLDSTGVVDFSTSVFNLGTVIAGDSVYQDLTLTNSGDFSVITPLPVSLPVGATLVKNECGTYMGPQKVCLMRFSFLRTTVGLHTEDVVMRSRDISDFTISVISTTEPGPPAGTIAFISPPASIIADGSDTKVIQTAPIRDQFNNIVSDGQLISILPFNLTVVGNTTQSTIGGIVQFTVKSTTVKGDATVTLLSGATGFLRFKALAGPAVGIIDSEPFIDTVQANGISQIDIRLNTLKDQFGNTVEDNSPVYFTLSSGGTLLGSTLNTVLGKVQQLVTPPTVVGTSVLTIKAGVVDTNSICGYSACGSYTLHYIPGPASGNIPVTPAFGGIFADPALGISLGERVNTLVSIGPVKDEFNNVIATNTSLTLELTNGVNVFNTVIQTDASGMSSFTLAGNGTRGPIKIKVTEESAEGNAEVWAYKDTTLRPEAPGLPTSAYKIFMTYYNSSSLPPLVDSAWGLVKSWGNIDIQDGNYFGDRKKHAPPTLVGNQFPYFTLPCFFNSGINLYAGACLQNDFNGNTSADYRYLIRKTSDDANMIEATLNQNKLSLHTEAPEGCYKQDIQSGSLTYGLQVVMSGIDKDHCGVVSVFNPSGAGVWYGAGGQTPISYILKYPSRAYISDLDKLLYFGGYYSLPINDSFGGNFLTVQSKRSTWFLSQGGGITFTEDGTGAAGDYPGNNVMPSMTASNRNIFLFGGLNLNNYVIGGSSDYASVTNPKDDFYMYRGDISQWQALSPNGDSAVTDENQSNSPTARYQNGLLYIPDNNSLLLGSGKTFISNLWVNANDLWSLKLDDLNDLNWKRECFPCNFPANAHFHPSTPFSSDSQLAPTPLQMTWNPYIQKVLFLWTGTNNGLSFLNPLTSGNKTVTTSDSYSFNTGGTNLVSSNLYQIEVNPSIGRTFFYKRNTVNSNNSELWYWDMDTSTKQYYRAEIDLGGAGAKTYIRDLSIHVNGYGKITNLSNVVSTQGLSVSIFNYSTNQWELVQTNGAGFSFNPTPDPQISITYSPLVSANYVSSSGKINLIISPIGTTSSSGYNEVFIDEIYVNGTF